MSAENPRRVTRDVLRQQLIKSQFPPELVDRALDCWFNLLQNAPGMLAVLDKDPMVAWWSQYGFMQGFVAGATVQAHLN